MSLFRFVDSPVQPVDGGFLDQTAWWWRWREVAVSEMAYWKERLTDGGA